MSNTEVVNKLFDSAGLTASIYDLQGQQEIAATEYQLRFGSVITHSCRLRPVTHDLWGSNRSTD